MSTEGLLAVRRRDRADLLRGIDAVLRSDCRVRAAWLTGSAGRGEDDALSDIDLLIAVADNAISDFVENRRAHAARPGRPVLLMDNLINAPTRGAYLLALYEGRAGPQHVDWFWQPESETRRPDQAHTLFDRAHLRCEASGRGTPQGLHGLPLGPNPSNDALLGHKIAFFWAMSVIVAKYIARRNGGGAARMTGVVARTLAEAEALCGSRVAPLEGHERMVAGLEAASAEAQLQVLREFARRANALGGQLAAQGVAVPTEAVRQISQFFDLAEALAAAGADLLHDPTW